MGSLAITSGGTVADSSVTIGASAGGSGTVRVGGGAATATWTTSGDLTVGASGTGTLTITNGGIVADLSATLGSSSDGNGTANVGGGTGNAIWTTSGKLTVGNKGRGTLNINSGGVVNASALDGTLTVSPGDFDQNGVVDAGDYNIWRSTFRSTSDLRADANGNRVVDMADYVAWRNAADGNSFINFDGGKLSITGTDSSSNLMKLQTNGGTIEVPTPGTTFTITSAILGVGQLTKAGPGALVLSGTNTYSGLTTVSGGTLAVNGAIAGGASVGSGATFQGVGSVAGTLTVNSGGTVAPGNPLASSNRIGTLTLGGLTLSSGAEMDIEIAGAVAGSSGYDVISVNGIASLGGQLKVIGASLGSPWFLPTVGEKFDIITTTGGTVGAFSAPGSQWVTGGETIRYSTTYAASKVTLQVTSIDMLTAGDFNGDGKVDSRDYVIWRDELGTHLSAADADQSGTVDANDYKIWRSHFGMAGGAGAEVSSSVPEPASWMLMVAGLVGTCGARRGKYASV
jgi:autotransporter-associated beta strand protein/T5SS/PEP-CTERM-associated repeat protein